MTFLAMAVREPPTKKKRTAKDREKDREKLGVKWAKPELERFADRRESLEEVLAEVAAHPYCQGDTPVTINVEELRAILTNSAHRAKVLKALEEWDLDTLVDDVHEL
jgi:hypothetical protein